MSCEEYATLITAYVDDELSPEKRGKLDAHLAGCSDCQDELAAQRAVKEQLAMIQFTEPSDVELRRYWANVYNRLERGIGWCLLSAGVIVLLCYGAMRLIEDFIANPKVALALKIGVTAVIVGAVVLFVSLLRERLRVLKGDRYSKEIKR